MCFIFVTICSVFILFSFQVEVRVKAKPDEKTGMVMDIAILKKDIQDLIATVDHKFIDKDVPWFATRPSTVENICIFFYEELAKKMPAGVKLNKVKVWETEKNIASYKG